MSILAALRRPMQTAMCLKSTWRASMNKTGEPNPVGKSIYEQDMSQIPPEIFKEIQCGGYHAGPYEVLKDQIDQGRFNDIGKPIYFTPDATVAAHFGARDPSVKSVLVWLSSTETPEYNEFHHLYVESGDGNFIREAYEISPEYLHYVKNPELQLRLVPRVRIAARESLQALRDSVEIIKE